MGPPCEAPMYEPGDPRLQKAPYSASIRSCAWAISRRGSVIPVVDVARRLRLEPETDRRGIQGRTAKDNPVPRRAPFSQDLVIDWDLDSAPALADALAADCAALLRAQRADRETEGWAPGLERPVVDMLLDSQEWRTERVWNWRRPAHINLLEQRTVTAFVKERIRRREQCRCVLAMDSRGRPRQRR